ncbi:MULTISPECIES: MFS transporter [unclassified Pseudomonas]|uniref:MFS transporter n=1 Tax=unclassified Pseudomonas TaxID=196821 RepID=UPI00087647E8|nr:MULTISPECIES: MFS transporter [unclassified Pseudomonas]MBB1616668.1 MFS transporter [Pseudomonas sp. UMC65]MBB1618499.1 MFS transporter [Pseudomonas sp. UME65]SCZ74585.1 Predicted arabinose efflux permease, MFS family [Pseudomonas sp. NFPP17]SDA82861.1 Predicted arabinose efflux permease, MFS family [Pseudomonas sp. NFPP15]SEL84475.1 Predicted arabinose efflux permease, MFS family [Pseudomonas sp. NFPP18]
MNPRSLLPLALALLMFPQLAQTLYSPALADLGRAFGVAPAQAAQSLSVFVLGFAPGVLLWGRLSDLWGRRPALLGGLTLYVLAIGLQLQVQSFTALLLCQALAALGVAAGSVVTQTLLRDLFRGSELVRVFSLVGMFLAASPAIGLFSGAGLVRAWGYQGALAGLLVLALALLGWCARALPETRAPAPHLAPLAGTLWHMLRDPGIWRSALLVALFNVALLSYYSLGPFLFRDLGWGEQGFGYSGAGLALASGLGAWLNRRLLGRGWSGDTLLRLAALAVTLGGLGVTALGHSLWLLLPMLGVVLGFGLAIPNILGSALAAYSDRLGSAGAGFGLFYYLLIGAGLLLVGWGQALGPTLGLCGVAALLLCLVRRRQQG